MFEIIAKLESLKKSNFGKEENENEKKNKN
jgi:hypothetical protein